MWPVGKVANNKAAITLNIPIKFLIVVSAKLLSRQKRDGPAGAPARHWYLHVPGEKHLQAAKHVLLYLKGTVEL